MDSSLPESWMLILNIVRLSVRRRRMYRSLTFHRLPHIQKHFVEPRRYFFGKIFVNEILNCFKTRIFFLREFVRLFHRACFELHDVFVVHVKNSDAESRVGDIADDSHAVKVGSCIRPTTENRRLTTDICRPKFIVFSLVKL